jgi:hypothetical protein
MGWWNKLVRGKKAEEEKPLSEKEKATAKGEPWVRVLNVEMNPDNPGEGYFELDWNEHFVKKLKDAGYTGNNDEEVIDLWFTALCRGIGEQDDFQQG